MLSPTSPIINVYCHSRPHLHYSAWASVVCIPRSSVSWCKSGFTNSASPNQAQLVAFSTVANSLRSSCHINVYFTIHYLYYAFSKRLRVPLNLSLWKELDKILDVHTVCFNYLQLPNISSIPSFDYDKFRECDVLIDSELSKLLSS